MQALATQSRPRRYRQIPALNNRQYGFLHVSPKGAYLLSVENKRDGQLSGADPALETQLLLEARRDMEIDDDLRMHIRELQWAHRRSSGPQAFTCFQDAKKERAV